MIDIEWMKLSCGDLYNFVLKHINLVYSSLSNGILMSTFPKEA